MSNYTLSTYSLFILKVFTYSMHMYTGMYSRVVQVDPDHCLVQVQVLGLEHVPPFWQGRTHTAGG